MEDQHASRRTRIEDLGYHDSKFDLTKTEVTEKENP